MEIHHRIATSNYEKTEIPVEFLVLHYSAGSRERCKDTFENPSKEVSAHIVIDEDGTVDEVIPCLNGVVYKARHAWRSRYVVWENVRTEFNDISIGIELINRNGNLFPYPQEQYDSLITLIKQLQLVYPSLSKPERIVGHEHIAWYRGKVDPGRCFDRKRIRNECFPQHPLLTKSVVPEALIPCFERFKEVSNNDPAIRHALNYAMEETMKNHFQS